MARRGRPPSISADQLPDLVAKLREYVETTELPIIAEFCYMNEIHKQFLYERDEFATLLKKAVAKKEANLERKTLTGEYNATMAVFSLKQLGWHDKQQVESNNTNNNVNQDITNLPPNERRARIDELNRRRGIGTDSAS